MRRMALAPGTRAQMRTVFAVLLLLSQSRVHAWSGAALRAPAIFSSPSFPFKSSRPFSVALKMVAEGVDYMCAEDLVGNTPLVKMQRISPHGMPPLRREVVPTYPTPKSQSCICEPSGPQARGSCTRLLLSTKRERCCSLKATGAL